MGRSLTGNSSAILNAVVRRWRRLSSEAKEVKQTYTELLEGVKMLSTNGRKDRIWWNGKEIRYIPLTDGKVDIKYVVASPISGNTAVIRPRDHMFKNGKVNFSSISHIIVSL